MIATLSLWRDPETAQQFTYGGLHSAALKRRRDAFFSKHLAKTEQAK